MAEQTTNYIEIDGEGKYIEDTAAREGVSQNAADIAAINGKIPASASASNKLTTQDEVITVKTLSATVIYEGTIVKVVRAGKTVMINVFCNNVPVTFNTRTLMASGLPKPANGISPFGFSNWGGMATNHCVEINSDGQLLVVGSSGTSSTLVTVYATLTYVTSD